MFKMFCNTKLYVRKQIMIGFCLNIGHVMVGYAVGWSAPMIPVLQDLTNTPLPTVVTDTQASWVGSSLLLGCVIGGPLSNLSDVFGRKTTIILGGVLSIISNIITTTAKSFVALIFGRFLFGVGTLSIAVVNIVYIGEIASTNLRGIILTSTGIFHTFGVLCAYSVGPFVSFTIMGYIGIFLGVLHVVVNLCIPESPVFYALKDDKDAVKTSLEILGRSKDLNDVLKLSIDQSNQIGTGRAVWKDIITIKHNRKALLITLALFGFQFGGGIVAVTFFATTIFESAGSSIEPRIATIIIGATSFSGALLTPMFIEKFGRKILLMFSSAVCCASMAVLGWYFYLDKDGNPLVSTLGWLPLASLVISIFAFGAGLNILPNTMLGELYSPKVRSIGSSISLSSGMLTGFAVNSCFGYMINGLGSYGTFWTFSLINAVAFMFTVLYVPETKGKTLLEIELMLK